MHRLQYIPPPPSEEVPRDAGGGRRAHGRIHQQALLSTLGPVLDLSAGGMRLLSTKRIDGEHDVMVLSGSGSVEVRARTCWCRRLGLFRFEVGMAFVGVPPQAARTLAAIAVSHRLLLSV